jgi:very-short-patch-repair endonuclease
MTRQLALETIGPVTTRESVSRAAREIKRRKNERFERELAFQIKAHGLPEPHEQYFFAEELGRKFRADFAWPASEYRFLLEVQGGIWRRGGGAHSHPQNIERDIERGQIIALLGWIFVPVTTDQVKSGHAIAVLERLFAARGWRR